MKKIKISAFLLVVVLLSALVMPSAQALDDPQIDCYSAVLLALDGSNETLLYQKNQNEKVYPASLTKVMTVLLAVEAVEAGTVGLSDPVTAQPGFDFDMIVGGTSANITTGETMSLENLLYCAMVASANDACNVIAMHLSGTVGDFVNRMNERAAELGCANTHFTNTHGLPDENHYTTAWDFSRILREAASHELFMTVSGTVDYTVPSTNSSNERSLTTTNSLISDHNTMYPGDYKYEYAQGIKTGHTNDAGYCLASSAQKDDIRLLSVVFNGDAYEIDASSWYYAHFADTRTLYDWAFNNFAYQEIVKSTEIVDEVPVSMGSDADTVAVRPSTSIVALLPTDDTLEGFQRTITLTDGDKPLEAPVSAGQVVGEIVVSKDGVIYGSANLVTSTSVELSRVQYMKSQIGDTLRKPVVVIVFWGLVLLFAAYILLVVRYRSKRRAYKKRLEEARQIHLDMDEDDEDVRYVPRPRRGSVPRNSVVLEPEKTHTDNEPTRELNTGASRRRDADEPTRSMDLSPEEKKVQEQFDEFFEKK